MNIIVRQEQKTDYDIVFEIIEDAFNSMPFSDGSEGELVFRLRKSANFEPRLSLVAEDDGMLVGHILFTPIHIVDGENKVVSLSLAPVSVLPEYQRKGIGSQLIKEGHSIARELGYESVFVLGHPEYYPYFGYEPSTNWNISSPFDVPAEYFMAIELKPGALKEAKGTVVYPKEFE